MKIAVIGGAGVRTVIFINGLLGRYKKLNIDKVTLYDTDSDKQAVIAGLCRYVIEKNGKDLELEVADTPEKAIKGADYIVTTLRVGGDHSRVIDEETALKNNVIGQETTGVGGFSMAYRTIPVLIGYCEMIQRLAPDAWVFNFTNPSGLVTQALKSAGYSKIIGICDAPSSEKYRIANYLGVPEENLYMEFFGLNHLSWVRSVKLNDRDIMDELIASDRFLKEIQEFSMFDPDVIRSLGMLPNEYLYYYYHREEALQHISSAGATRGKIIEQVNLQMMEELHKIDIGSEPEEALQTFLYYMEKREQSYMSIETGNKKKEDIKKGELEVPDGMGYAGVMLDCIEGLQSKKGRTLVLSVENKGAIDMLEDNDVVEITCNVSDKGIEPVHIGRMPEHCSILVNNIKYYEKLTVRSVMQRIEEEKNGETGENSRKTAIDALTLHPLVGSYSLAKKLIFDYEKAYGMEF